MFKRLVDAVPVVTLSFSKLPDRPTEEACQEFGAIQALFLAQPAAVKEHLQAQAALLAEALKRGMQQVQLSLPEGIILGTDQICLPAAKRRHQISSKNGLLVNELRQCLSGLERSVLPAVGAGAALLRYITAIELVHDLAAVELPEAFDRQGQHLAGTVEQARACFESLQNSLRCLQAAVSLASYVSADEIYREKREELLEQLSSQGIALAAYETKVMIDAIHRRAAANQLNRGFSLDLPYYDDQQFSIKTYSFEVIPQGRILFEPYYVMWVAREEQEKVSQEDRLSPTSRKHLLAELKTLEKAFEVPGMHHYRRQPVHKKNSLQTRLSALRLALSTLTTDKSKGNRKI